MVRATTERRGVARKRRGPAAGAGNKLSRLIYPVYTVWRNKFARPQGQGVSAQERVITGISGSQTGGQGVLDISISELVQSGGSFSNWPLNLPASGNQTEVFLNVPYRSI
jgi:hypothetical protein